ncbi:MAG: nitroreductase family protein [Candidatus Hodarchaeales archaeon]
MEFRELINERRSIRKYTGEDVTKEEEMKILEAANMAPSAGNLQGYGIFSIRNQEKKELLAEASWGHSFISKAPLVLVFYAETERSAMKSGSRGIELYSVQDAIIATVIAHLAVTDLGLGSVWIGAFDNDKVGEILDLPADKIPVAILTIGHPGEKPEKTTRRTLDDLVTFVH